MAAFNEKETNEIFQLLENMMKAPKSHQEPDQLSLARWVYIVSAALVVFMFAAAYYECQSLAKASYVIFCLFVFAYWLRLVLFLFKRNLERVRCYHAIIINDFKGDFTGFKDVFERLLGIEKVCLEYALSHLRQKLIHLDRSFSTSLIFFGVFIASVVFMFEPIALGSDEKNSQWIRMFPLLIVVCSIVYFGKIIELRKRPDQLVNLLECAIRAQEGSARGYVAQEPEESVGS